MASSKNSIGVKLIACGEDPTVDIIAVHGLHGDAYGTWTAKATPTEKEVLWLRDLLPAEVPNARILAYGYDSDPGKIFDSTSTNMVHHHATTLVSELHFYRRREHERRRPIIFVCHSLGGIVVKRALIYSSTYNLSHNVHLRSIKISTYGIVFLGTPHMGADLARWGKMAEMLVRMVSPKSWVDSNNALIKTLEKNSETLQNITDQFLSISQDFRMFFFWEELKTAIPGMGPQLIVEYSSAVPEALPDAGRAAIHANHSDMAKFRDKGSPGWNVLAGCLYTFAEQAPSVIERNWAQEQRRNLQAARDHVANIIYNAEGRLSNSHLPGSRTSSPGGGRRITERGDIIQPDEVSEFGVEYYESRNGSQNLLIKNTPFVKPLSLQENKYFEGREDELNIIHSILSDPHKRVVSISSVTGGGKTHLAREYFFHRKSDFPGGAFWIDCGPMKSTLSTESLDLGYCMIAEELGLVGSELKKPHKRVDPKETTRLEVRNWFDKHDGWLLVLDGANVETNDEVNLLSEYVPKSKGGSILLTTLNSAFAGSVRLGSPERLELGQITTEEAVRMVMHYAQIKNPSETEIEAAHKLVEDLEHNPLAIQSAGSYIKGKKVSVSDYWKKYEKRPFVEREYLEPFHIIFDRLDERADRYGEAGNLLRLIAFLHREIPVQMLDFGIRHLPAEIKLLAKDGSRRDLNNTIGHLLAYSLVDRSGREADNVQVDTLVLHSVVQDVCISRLRKKPGELKKWLELAIRMYCSSFETMESRHQHARFLVSDYRRYELHGARLLEHAKRHKVSIKDLEGVLGKLMEAIRADDEVEGPRYSMFATGSGSESAPETPSVSPESSRRPTWEIKPENKHPAEVLQPERGQRLAQILKERKEEWSHLADDDTPYDTDTEHWEPRSRRTRRPKPREGDKPYKFRYEPPSGQHSPWIPKDGRVPVYVKPPDSRLSTEDVIHSPRFDSGGASYPPHPAAGAEDNIESTSRRALRALLRTPTGFSSLDPSLPRPGWPWNIGSSQPRSPLRSVSPTPSDIISGKSVKNGSTFPASGDAPSGSVSRGRSPVRRNRASLGDIDYQTPQRSIPYSGIGPGVSSSGLPYHPIGGSIGPSSYPPPLRRQSTPGDYPGEGGIDMPDKPLYSEIVSKPKPFSPGFSPSRDLSSSPIARSIVGPRYDRPPSSAWSEPILEHDDDFSPRGSPFGSTSMVRAISSTATGERRSPRVVQLQASASGRGRASRSPEPMFRQRSGGAGPGSPSRLATPLQRVVSEPLNNPGQAPHLGASAPGLGIGGLHIPFGRVPEVTIAPNTPDYMISEESFRGGILGGGGLLTGEAAQSERRSSVPESGSGIESADMQRSKSEPDYITGFGLQQMRRRSPSGGDKIHKD